MKWREPSEGGDLSTVGRLAEADTLELHAVTMTGRRGLVVYRPESIQVINLVRRMRREGLEVYFSMQTGPSVFINTYPENLDEVRKRIEQIGVKTLTSNVGDGVTIISE